jgi:hypothetical protein
MIGDKNKKGFAGLVDLASEIKSTDEPTDKVLKVEIESIAEDKDDNKKGFAGLVDLISDINSIDEPVKTAPEKTELSVLEPVRKRRISISSFKLYLKTLIISLLALISILLAIIVGLLLYWPVIIIAIFFISVIVVAISSTWTYILPVAVVLLVIVLALSSLPSLTIAQQSSGSALKLWYKRNRGLTLFGFFVVGVSTAIFGLFTTRTTILILGFSILLFVLMISLSS